MDKVARPVVRPYASVEPAPVAGTRGARMAVLIGRDEGAPAFVTRRFVLEPGGLIPAHGHDDIEHEQVFVRGEVVLTLDGVEHVVRAGDAVLIPAGCSHRYENRGDVEAEFICVIPLTDGYHTSWHEEPPR
jgi:quercetin dioxygenase-like cupin family protein